MTNRQIEQRLKAAVQSQAPNDLEGVLSRCGQKERSTVVMRKHTNRNSRIFAGLAAVAACLALAFGINWYTSAGRVTAHVSLDVNPSVQLDLNQKNRVLKANALNEDAQIILKDMDLEGVEAETAVNAVIGSMVKNGYVGEDANSILISVESKDQNEAAELRQKLSQTAQQSMQQDQVEAAVLSQVIQMDDDLIEKANEYNISLGKAQLARQLAKQNAALRFEELAQRPVNDLNLLSEKVQDGLDTKSIGKASDGKYIGRETAEQAALAYAGVDAAQVVFKSTDFDLDDGVMVYEVEFYANGSEYEIDVDALTGAIRDSEVEPAKVDPTNVIEKEAAQQQAIQQAEAPLEAVQDLKVELDEEDGILIYDVEFTYEGYRYDVELDATTGAIRDIDRESLNPVLDDDDDDIDDRDDMDDIDDDDPDNDDDDRDDD